MTVRFKNQSEYQKSYGVSRSRSVSPQRRHPLAGLRSDQTDSPASRSFSAHKNPPSRDSKPSKVFGSASKPQSLSETRASADLQPPPKPEPYFLKEMNDRKSEPSRPVMAPSPEEKPGNQVDQTMSWTAGGRPGGQRSGGHRSEYHRQFGRKKPVPGASPLLTAEQVLHSSSRSVPPFKKNPVSMETEYRRSFQGSMPPSGPRLRKHSERQSLPVFHTYRIHRRKSLEPQNQFPPKAETPQSDVGSESPPRTTARPAQAQRRRRNPEGGGATDDIAEQVKELRQQALMYRCRAWGTNFSRNHSSQSSSEYNSSWEPTDTTDSHTEPSTPRLSPQPDSPSASCVEASDSARLSSNSSRRSSVGAGGKTQGNTEGETLPGPEAERQTAWGEETDEHEGRLPTPKLKTRPAQRTHHDSTTPATGGAILVGKSTNMDDSSPDKQKQKFGAAVPLESGSEVAVDKSTKVKEAWSENPSSAVSPSPTDKRIPSPQPKPIRTHQASHPPALAPPSTSHPQHGFQGMSRHPDFQHNGELGLRFRERPCSRGGCGSDEDDRLSVMSWRSAASCSAASAILERAQKRRENFWGKR